jgi:hypothetical protein
MLQAQFLITVRNISFKLTKAKLKMKMSKTEYSYGSFSEIVFDQLEHKRNSPVTALTKKYVQKNNNLTIQKKSYSLKLNDRSQKNSNRSISNKKLLNTTSIDENGIINFYIAD